MVDDLFCKFAIKLLFVFTLVMAGKSRIKRSLSQSSPISFFLDESNTYRDNEMKIQCDMCAKKEAVVYCTADEASLCHGCDRRVHHANKLASKHPRFSLQYSSDDTPYCDICQERRAFLFCKEDRAILCRECDISIHTANEHTQYHCRFLLAGVKLSCYDNSSDQAMNSSNSNGCSETESNKSCIVSELQNLNNSTSVNDDCAGVRREEGASISMEASSITEYLMETLPGWHVEELLDPSVPHPYDFYEGYGSGTCTLSFMAHDSDNNGDLDALCSEDLGALCSEDLGVLVYSSSSISMSRDHKRSSRTSSMPKRFVNGSEGLKKDQYSFNSSTTKRPRQQLW